MRLTIYLFHVAIIFLISCKQQEKAKVSTNATEIKTSSVADEDNNLIQLTDNPEFERDRIIISANEGDSLIYSKNDLFKIEKLFPVLKESIARSPTEAYFFSGIWKEYKTQTGARETISFGSEVGQDKFYLLYAYYTKKQNGEETYKSQREKLLQLYHAINGIYEGLNYGGTFFGHQYKRIAAFAEYSIYLYSKNQAYFDKKYDFNLQKSLYIKLLRQYIEDEEAKNVYNSIKDKAHFDRKKEFEEKIKILDKLMTNYFYLNQVQIFEMENYK